MVLGRLRTRLGVCCDARRSRQFREHRAAGLTRPQPAGGKHQSRRAFFLVASNPRMSVRDTAEVSSFAWAGASWQAPWPEGRASSRLRLTTRALRDSSAAQTQRKHENGSWRPAYRAPRDSLYALACRDILHANQRQMRALDNSTRRSIWHSRQPQRLSSIAPNFG
jgi:hypothetical protein